MKLGVMLPLFDARADRAFQGAHDAVEAGFAGLFCYDHLWPMGRPGLPALVPYPVLGALSAVTTDVRLGTLVARVGIEADWLYVDKLVSLNTLSGGRMIAGIGTGDHKSEAENLALGLRYGTAGDRHAALRRVAIALVGAGVETWIGGGGARTNAIAWDLGLVLNLWAATPEAVADAARRGRVTWGGTVERATSADQLKALSEAGAEWAVATWPRDLDALAKAAPRGDL